VYNRLQIAVYLLTRYTGHCQPWRFDRASYVLALQTQGVEAPAVDLLVEDISALLDRRGTTWYV
jgi:hypothetical protein